MDESVLKDWGWTKRAVSSWNADSVIASVCFQSSSIEVATLISEYCNNEIFARHGRDRTGCFDVTIQVANEKYMARMDSINHTLRIIVTDIQAQVSSLRTFSCGKFLDQSLSYPTPMSYLFENDSLSIIQCDPVDDRQLRSTPPIFFQHDAILSWLQSPDPVQFQECSIDKLEGRQDGQVYQRGAFMFFNYRVAEFNAFLGMALRYFRKQTHKTMKAVCHGCGFASDQYYCSDACIVLYDTFDDEAARKRQIQRVAKQRFNTDHFIKCWHVAKFLSV